jgi:hypothetical protein
MALLTLPLSADAGTPAQDGVDHLYELAAELGMAKRR